jgi:EAL and modified HD-GYP domain-containing signal transduction protein
MTESNCLISRQPIYGPAMEVTAYELRTNYIPDEGDARAAEDQMRTIYKMFTDEGLDQVVGDRQGLVTLTPEALAQGLWKEIPKSRVLLGYFQKFEPSDETAKQLSEIASQGYNLALSGALSQETLNVVQGAVRTLILDVSSFMPGELRKRVDELREFHSNITAARVDTYDDLEYCKELEFDFFQGHFLFRPATPQNTIPVNRMNMMRLLSKLHDPNIQIPEIEKQVSQDVALSYKILQNANSAGTGLSRRVNSAGHAVRLIGLETIRTWSSALLLSSVDNKPRELMTSALIRARMCELLGETTKGVNKESFASAGLMSVLDAMLDCSMEKALAELPLADDIKSALIRGDGPIGQALRCTIAYEHANWDEVQYYGLAPAGIREKYMASISWASKLSAGLLN